MKKSEFISISKRMVKEYFNRYVDKVNVIRSRDVEVSMFLDESDKYKILLTTDTPDDLFYGVTYDKGTDELYSYVYKRDEIRIMGKKNIEGECYEKI